MHLVRRLKGRAAISILLVLTLVSSAACGGDDEAGTSNGSASEPSEETRSPCSIESTSSSETGGIEGVVTAADAFVAEAKEPLEEWPGPTEPIVAIGDKSVFIVSCGA